MEWTENDEEVLIKSLATDSPYYSESLDTVKMLNGKIVSYKFDKEGLIVKLPSKKDMFAPIVLKVY